MTNAPVIYWMRRDFRLSDNPALAAAVEAGGPVLPVFIDDPVAQGLGAAPRWRLGLAVETFAEALAGKGSRLIIRQGEALPTLRALIEETGARAVYWNRLYDPDAVARDTEVKSALKEDGIEARSHAGHLINEPWTVETGTGGFYKVYTPFWKAVRGRDIPDPVRAPARIPAPESWPDSLDPADLDTARAMNRGAEVVRPHLVLGEDAARNRLDYFIAEHVADYDSQRDRLDMDGTSRLSEPLSLGEIGPRTCWHAGRRAMEEGKAGAETFLKELIWRDFAYHLVHHTPRITSGNWREEWDAFPWRGAEGNDDLVAWRRGRTGIEVVDAAMRELYVTGRMHNRARMLVASYLTKHLMTHWKHGLSWFEDCLVDWDPASNAMGWQWSAGSGPDATPYFRVFNPETQAEKFDPQGRYRRKWVAELSNPAPDTARSYFDAIPRSWGLAAGDPYPSEPIVSASEGRKRALAAYENRDF